MNRFDIMMRVVDQLYGRKRIGEILLEEGRITAEELGDALEAQRSDPLLRKLGTLLVAKGSCSASDVMGALSRQLDVCVAFRASRAWAQ